MKPPRKDLAIRQVAQLLSGFLDCPLTSQRSEPRRNSRLDAALQFGPNEFLIEWKSTASSSAIHSAIAHLTGLGDDALTHAIPLIAVPYMGEAGKALCEEAGISWVDLSGNARITARRIRILVSGEPNRYRSSGRPSTVFAPKSSRIIRWLLQNPETSTSQKGIAMATDMDEGYTSRIVRRLDRESLIERDASGHIRVSRPRELLDEWHDNYSFGKHTILAGHIPTQTGAQAIETLANSMERQHLTYSLTGLAAAWLYTNFAMFRLVTLFVDAAIDERDLQDTGFRRTDRGPNAWIVTPNDAGVFCDSQVVDGWRCAHPIQVYLDLKGQPERAPEAAVQLMKTHIHFGSRSK